MEKFSGEVSAIVGYEKQYNFLAERIYDSLIENNLEWVEFASQEAGNLDDILIGLKDRILAYQIKTIQSSKITYHNLLNNIEAFYTSWKKIKSSYPDFLIEAKYITAQEASINDKITSYKNSVKPNFKTFNKNFWNKIRTENFQFEDLPKSWEKVFLELKEKAKADKTSDFIKFIQEFEIVTDYDFTEQNQIFDSYINRKRKSDIDKISSSIFNLIGRQGSKKLHQKDILQEFGLAYRYETHFKHSFFVDDKHYQPISKSIQKLEEITSIHSKGYIALIGNAGSGKSTLLTKWLSSHDGVVLKYYAYVNQEMNYEFGYRGEAKIFLKDLLVQLRINNYSKQDRIPTNDIDDLQIHFNKELNKLSYRHTKIYILVDGLDHIEREQQVNRSLIEILPPPEKIPNNIYFILGSRTINHLNNLNPRIVYDLKDNDRIVTIEPLNKLQISKLVSSHNLSLSENLTDALTKNTKGHPLFLRYTLEKLIRSDQNEYQEIISQKNFSGDIFNEYRIFWDKNKSDESFIKILALISRFRYNYIDIRLLKFFNIKAEKAEKIKKTAEHYFYKRDNIWQFFHNSFKEFLIQESAKDIFSETYDESIHRKYHKEIFDVIKGLNNEYQWNKLYHLFEAKDYTEILDITSQEYFRYQWFIHRSIDKILDDIHFSKIAAFRSNDISKALTAFFAGLELNVRVTNFSPSNEYQLFLDLNLLDLSNSFIFNEVELTVSKEVGLNYAFSLYKKGYEELAFQVFKKSEPDFILYTSKEVSSNRYSYEYSYSINEVELIINWSKVASQFISVSEIMHLVQDISIKNEDHEINNVDNLQFEVLIEIIKTSIKLQKWDNLKSGLIELEKIFEIDEIFYAYYDIVLHAPSNLEIHDKALKKLLFWEETNHLPHNRRLCILHTLIKKDIKTGEYYFEKLLSPSRLNEKDGIKEIDFLHYIFDYSRLFFIIYNDFSKGSSNLTPHHKEAGWNILFKLYANLGKYYAYLFKEKPDAAKGFHFELKSIFSLFHYNFSDPGYDYNLNQKKVNIINLILKISNKISDKFYFEILDAISEEWKVSQKYWRRSEKHGILLKVIELNNYNKWVADRLNEIDEELFQGNLYDQIEDAKFQITLWSKINQIEKGKKILDKLISRSLSIGAEKDYQLEYLIEWLSKTDPVNTEEIESVLKRIDDIDYSSSSISGASEIIFELSLYHGNGFNIYKYFIFNGILNFIEGTNIVLKYLLHQLPEYRTILTRLFFRIVGCYNGGHGGRLGFLKIILDSDPTVKELNEIVQDIAVYVVLEQRDSYYYLINQYCEKNEIDKHSICLPDFIKEPEKYSENNFPLRLKDGREIKEEKVISNIHTYEDLINWMESEDSYNSSFNWYKAFAKVLKNLSIEQVNTILTKKKISSHNLIEIAENLINSNKKEIAKTVLYKVLDQSESYGWTMYDGGSKIKTYQLLKKIDDDSSIANLAFQDFSEEKRIRHDEVLHKSIQIFRLFSSNLNYNSLYPVIKNYKDELIKNYKKDDNCPSVKGLMSDYQLLKKLLLFLINFPSRLDEKIIEILVNNTESELVLDIAHHLFEEKYYLKYLKLLSAYTFTNLDFGSEHQKNIIYLLNHERFDFHQIAVTILAKLNIDYKSHFHRKNKELPLTYRLNFDYSPELVISSEERMDRLKKTGYLRDTNDPLEFIETYRLEVDFLSKEAGIEKINIAHRIIQLGKLNDFPHWAKNLSEKEIRDIYEFKFRQTLPYVRPRNLIVWDGLMIVTKELLELGYISRYLANLISNVFDPKTYFIKTNKQPIFIKNILDKSNYAPSSRKEWVSELNEEYLNQTIPFQIDKSWRIIGEYSEISSLGDGTAVETRQGFISTSSEKENDSHYIFPRIYKNYIDHYSKIESDENEICLFNHIIVLNPKRNWIAINPKLAIEMGLKLSSEGNFRWVDEENNTIIESIYWQNNDINNRNRAIHSDSGFGWLLLINNTGWDKLVKILGEDKLYHHKLIKRHLIFIQSRFNTYIDEENSIYKTFPLSIS